MFLAPLFLVGLLAAAIPLVLHLRRSTQVKKITFSTTRFFDEAFIRSARRARLQDRLVMLLRMALFALFALALAQPLLRLPGYLGLAGLGGGGRTVALVLDDSASMGLTGAQGPLLERAKAGALAVLEELSPAGGDKATVILAGYRDGGPRALFDQPTADLEAVRQAIRAVPLTDLATDVASAVERAAEQLGSGAPGSARGEVFIFSDLQRTSLAGEAALDPGPGAAVMFVAVRPEAGESPVNLSLDALQYGAAQPMLGLPFTFRALVTNHGPSPAWASVQFVLDEEVVARQTVQLAPGGSRVVRFLHRFSRPGWYRGRVSLAPVDEEGRPLGPDALPADNDRHFALQVEDQVRVLAVNGAPSEVPARDELFFFRLALRVSLPEVEADADRDRPRLDEIGPEQVTPDRLREYPLLLLANLRELPPAALEAVERYADGGGSVLITLGDRVDRQSYLGWTGPQRLHGGLLPGPLGVPAGVVEAAADEAVEAAYPAGFVAEVAEDHPALAGFRAGELGELSAVRLRACYPLPAGDGAVLMRSAEGLPLLVERRFGRGRVMVWASSLDRDWTNFPMQPQYVPWVFRVVSYLCQPQLGRQGFVRTGQQVALPHAATDPKALQVRLPDGATAYPTWEAAGGAAGPVLRFSQTERAGVYQVQEPGSAAGPADGPRWLFAANLPDEEAVTDYLAAGELEERMGPQAAWTFIPAPEGVAEQAAVARRGIGLWNQLLILALAVGLFEPWLANRLSKRRQATTADAMGQLDRGARRAAQTQEDQATAA